MTTHYGWPSIILHWVGAAALILSFVTGEALEDVSGAARTAAYDSHVLWASILAVPLIARVLWRIRDGFKPTAQQHPLLVLLARLVMWGLIASIAGGVLTGLALLLPMGRSLHEVLEGAHGLFAHIWLPLLALHILGALKHAIWDRDGVFSGIFRPGAKS